MSLRYFIVLQMALLALGLAVIRYQRAVLHEIHSERASAMAPPPLAQSLSDSPTPPSHPPADAMNSARPSLELLQLRAEVSRLRAELDALNPQAQAATREADEWNQVWDGPKPSQSPGFRSFSDMTLKGWASPEAAYESFQYAFRNQPVEALTPTRMKEIFDLPDDFDDPKARYSIDLGAGMQGNLGYRIVETKMLEPGRVELAIEIENRNGTSFRETRTFIQSDGRWRMKLAGIQRLPDLPAEEEAAANQGEVRTRSEPVFLP